MCDEEIPWSDPRSKPLADMRRATEEMNLMGAPFIKVWFDEGKWMDAGYFSVSEMTRVVAALCNTFTGPTVVGHAGFFSVDATPAYNPTRKMFRRSVPLLEPAKPGMVTP